MIGCAALVGEAVKADPGGELKTTPDTGVGAAGVGKAKKADASHDLLRLRFEVLEVRPSIEQVERIHRSTDPIDAQHLAIEAIEQGNATVRNAFSTPVIVGKDVSLTVGNRIPLVRGSSTSESGKVQRQIRYEQVGCVVCIGTAWVDPQVRDHVIAECKVEISAMITATTPEISEGVVAPRFTETSQEFTTVLRVGAPVYLSSLSSNETLQGESDDTSMYVYRAQVDRVLEETQPLAIPVPDSPVTKRTKGKSR